MHENENLDLFDMRLITQLQADASQTHAVLAERIGLSASQVSRRRQALEERGIITGYRATISAAAVGLRVCVFIHVTLDTHSRDNAQRFRDLVRMTPAILEAHTLTGEADYLLKVVVTDLKSLATLINDVLLAHDSVARVRSEIVLDTLKDTEGLPVSART